MLTEAAFRMGVLTEAAFRMGGLAIMLPSLNASSRASVRISKSVCPACARLESASAAFGLSVVTPVLARLAWMFMSVLARLA